MMIEDGTSLLREAVKHSPAAWFDTFSMIERKDGTLVRPKANVYQRRLSDIQEWCYEHGRPCRIVGLKPRQKGSSTFSVGSIYRRIQIKRGRGLIAGGAHFQGQNLFKILRTYAAHDELDPGSCKVMDAAASFANGGQIERITLANPNAGRSGTYQAMVLTEVAYLSDEGVRNADDVLNGLLKCVPHEPMTLIIQESTAKGASGSFYDTWEEGITFDELKAGKNGYVRVFAAWFEFDDSRMNPASEGISSADDYTEEEERLAKKWGLDMSQVAWMRWAIREECKGDFDRFCQDYPFDSKTAFLKSGRCRFDRAGLDYQRSILHRCPREFGGLEYNERSDRVSFVGSSEYDARCVRWEKPKVGCRYLLAIDPMTGESQTSGDDPDSHGVFVLRAGYWDGGRWYEPAVVMRNMLYPDGIRFGCWWDIDVLEEEVWRMARYWQAIVVPEMNMDRGLVELLKLRGDVQIYEREMFNRREQVRTKALGWMTDKRTRGKIIENLARGIREAGREQIGDGLEVRDPWTLDEMDNFVVKRSGRAEASEGKHDDSVLALAIGYQLVDGEASPWHEAVRRDWVPPDLRPLYDQPTVSRGGTFSC